MFYLILILIVVIFCTVVFRALSLAFFVRGLRLGFKLPELQKIRDILQNKLNSRPTSIFFKNSRLISCVLTKFYLSSEGQTSRTTIEKFYNLRDSLSKVRTSIDDKKATIATHTLSYGSQLSLSSKRHVDPINAMVIKNKECLVLFCEQEILDDRVSVYFWYQDAGYSFRTAIFKRENGHIWINHPKSVALVRRRQYTRVTLDIPGTFTIVNRTNIDYHPEVEPGSICRIKNISEGGLNLVTTGHGKPDVIMKINFKLKNQTIIVCALIKAVAYNRETNESIINLEFVETPPIKMYEPILSYIYGLSDDEASIS
ncbi:MAG: hypothetical protein ACRCVN_06090 [Spirochaetia bacterium]